MAFSSNRNSPKLVSEFGIETREVRADLGDHAGIVSRLTYCPQGATLESKLLRVENRANNSYFTERTLTHEERLGSFKNPNN